MNRRQLFRGVMAWIAMGGSASTARPGVAQTVATLNETLRSVLKCRRPEEFAFVDLVTQKVEQGVLPLALVLSMMRWARERRTDIPFPYFKEGLTRRAAAMGVNL